ncbi:AbrB/MazE/SpoVT family DNA-binding domain-containing protein [Microvenator marinus]|uniref:AbrB/MazE/SpoVT family DNA-binding domain-containing protein n=1 Tax=Microvenator marinus TaxID=2600177 RepID=A0A5B8XXL8_9DELT|nr:AbrB/MazE/SpoVT family DNA-binding domain-containing protein [Microvenator marinus]QED29911.1 AbrB/MazE/SpoVT family DNA-binding domain-containing protein [Microvenator marinus]
MQKKLSVVGNSLGLIIERPVLDLLRIDKDTPLEITTDGDVLIIRPVRDEKTERLREAAIRMAHAHASTFEKLAK